MKAITIYELIQELTKFDSNYRVCIKNNLQDFCDSVKSGTINPNTTIAKIFHENGIKVTA